MNEIQIAILVATSLFRTADEKNYATTGLKLRIRTGKNTHAYISWLIMQARLISLI